MHTGARQAVEILDVVGEQTIRGEGPVAQLREKFPGSEIVVDFTGKDGDHEQFVYVVKRTENSSTVSRRVLTVHSKGIVHIITSRSSLLR